MVLPRSLYSINRRHASDSIHRRRQSMPRIISFLRILASLSLDLKLLLEWMRWNNNSLTCIFQEEHRKHPVGPITHIRGWTGKAVPQPGPGKGSFEGAQDSKVLISIWLDASSEPSPHHLKRGLRVAWAVTRIGWSIGPRLTIKS